MHWLILASVCAVLQPTTAEPTPSYLLEMQAGVGRQPTLKPTPYHPQPGDIVLFDDHNNLITKLYNCCGTGRPLHAGVVFRRADGSNAILEAGTNAVMKVFIFDLEPEGHRIDSERCDIDIDVSCALRSIEQNVQRMSSLLDRVLLPQTKNIVEVASGNPDFSTLVEAVVAADLQGTLGGTGPFTVFAPTNAAFEAALADLGLTQDQLLASPDLGKILTYHVLPARVGSADITGPSSPETAEGSTLDVNAEGGTVTVGSDGATVVQADVEASNGVIHAIDKVLIPPTVTLG